jgi:hypothetical protein
VNQSFKLRANALALCRLITPPGAILSLLIAVFLMPSPAVGQVKLGTNALNVAPAATKPWAVTKTPDGQPDLQGY